MDEPPSFPDDRIGGGERLILFDYNRENRRWEGKLNAPVPRGHRWCVAVRSWVVPPLQGDGLTSSFCVKVIEPHIADSILAVDHGIDSVWAKRCMSGQATRLMWYPVDETLKDIYGITAIIASFDGKEYAPAVGQLHLVLDFAIAE